MSNSLSNESRLELSKLLGSTPETDSFIQAAETAINRYFAVKNAGSDHLPQGELTHTKSGAYIKVSNQSRKLWNTINEVPAGQWGQIEQAWLLRHGEPMPIDHLDMLALLQDLYLAAEKANSEFKPEKKDGVRKKSENWFFIDTLAKAFIKNFPQFNISRNEKSYFYRAVSIICESSAHIIAFADPAQAIREYIEK